MTIFRHTSIRRDLVILMMMIAALSIALTTLSMALIGYFNLRSTIHEELQRAATQGSKIARRAVREVAVEYQAPAGFQRHGDAMLPQSFHLGIADL